MPGISPSFVSVTGGWSLYPGNTGASRARNAGLLVRNGKTYRLAQSQGFERYGRSLKLFEITALSEREYSEKLISELSPARGLNATGIHHLSASGDTVVFDAKRTRFFWMRLPRLHDSAIDHAGYALSPCRARHRT